jgi:hypothetical protein
MLLSSPPQTLSFAEPRRKEVTSLEKSVGCDRSGKITEGKKMCVIGLEQVLQSPRLGTFWNMFLLGLRHDNFLEDDEMEEHTSVNATEWGCAITVQGFETATLFKRVLSADVKSVSEKCWLHTYCVFSFVVSSALQDFPSLCPQPCPVQQ